MECGWHCVLANAERHLAKAEGSKRRERGITQPLECSRRQNGKGRKRSVESCTERERSESGGSLETPCAREEAGLSLDRFQIWKMRSDRVELLPRL